MTDTKPKPPSDLPPLSPADSDEASVEDKSPSSDVGGEMAEAFDHFKKAASGLVAKAEPAVKNASDAMDRTFKDVGKKADAVMDKVDPMFDNAAAEAKRLANKLAKNAEPMTKQVQAGIAGFADKLGKWARGDEDEE